MVTVVSFTLMGIEGIADEIEMPFGYDFYDLPLGVFFHAHKDAPLKPSPCRPNVQRDHSRDSVHYR